MKLPFELFLALRYLKPKRTFVSIITVLSLLGVTLGVMVLIIVISVMSGFEKDLREKVMGFTAHITITNYEILRDYQNILIRVQKDPEVVGVSPFVMGPVLVNFQERISTPAIRGIDPAREESVIGLKHFIVAGEFFLEGESVIIGDQYAEKNKIEVGDKILIFSPRHIEEFRRAAKTGKQETTLPTELLVTGIFSTGMYDYDANFILTSLETAQEMYGLGDGVHGIAVRLKDPLKAPEVKNRLNQQLKAPIRAYTWMDLNRQLFSAIAVERNVMFFLLLFIVVVAAFGLTSTLITITVQKSREIGVLKALGAKEYQILWVFLSHGLVVGVLGSLLGLGSGLLLLRFRNSVAQFLSQAFGIEIFPDEIYQFSSIPAQINEHSIVVICLSAVVICVLAALIPAWSAARLQPARALRYE
ncbi:MAG: ABC transporter permease [Verrucomicrobiae bacterium]|nr:ABC transporter permease [Verrucomicrobiae bacterium]